MMFFYVYGGFMEYIISGLIVFVIVYLFYFFLIILRKNKLKLFKNNSYYKYLVKVYNLDTKKLDNKFMANVVAISNALIIGITCSIVLLLDNVYLQLLLALALLILLQLFIYHIVGTILKRREKNV
jgi:uncharacterized membrane protein